MWKNYFKDKDCILNTVDVVIMYRTLSVNIVEQALNEALTTCSDCNEDMINYIITLSKIHLNKNFIEDIVSPYRS